MSDKNYMTIRECIGALYERFEDIGSEQLKALYEESRTKEDFDTLQEILEDIESLVYERGFQGFLELVEEVFLGDEKFPRIHTYLHPILQAAFNIREEISYNVPSQDRGGRMVSKTFREEVHVHWGLEKYNREEFGKAYGPVYFLEINCSPIPEERTYNEILISSRDWRVIGVRVDPISPFEDSVLKKFKSRGIPISAVDLG